MASEEPEPLSKLQNTIHNIFGDSDSDDDLGEVKDVNFDSDDEEDAPLPSFTKRAAPLESANTLATPTSKRKRKERKEPKRRKERREDAPVESKSEAQQDIDVILARLKPVRNVVSSLSQEVVIDERIQMLIDGMRKAAATDLTMNANKEPAIAKLKMLEEVMATLNKPGWGGMLLEADVLEFVKLWLEPMPDGSLPALDIQRGMMSSMEGLRIETDHLRQSLVGRVVMFYAKCERVEKKVRRMAQGLVSRWMRPILGKSVDERHKIVKRGKSASLRAVPIVERSNNAALPRKVVADFNVVPISNIIGGSEKKRVQYKKLKSLMNTKR